MSNNQSGNKGAQNPNTTTSDYNAQTFLIAQMLARVSTCKLVKIVAVTNAGGLAAVGFVDVLPLVNQLDGENKTVEHTTVYDIPYFRLQGGTNAVIIDPQIGDIGVCVFADRDISKVKATKKQADPGSKRSFNMADGLYIGGVLNGVPVQFVRFSTDGIEVVSPTRIKFVAPLIELDASTSITSTSPLIEMDATTITGNASSSVDLNTPTVSASTLVHSPLVVASTSVVAPTVSGTIDVLSAGKSGKNHQHNNGSLPMGPTTGPI